MKNLVLAILVFFNTCGAFSQSDETILKNIYREHLTHEFKFRLPGDRYFVSLALKTLKKFPPSILVISSLL
jgi:hypothetical protein